MPSFDVTSEVDWQEVANARTQAIKEVGQRFDFKGVQATIDVDTKTNTISVTSSRDEKIEALVDLFREKLAKRGISQLAYNVEKAESSLGGGARSLFKVQVGIDKDKAKKIVKTIKDMKNKAQAQIQDNQVRVTSKKRDELQDIIAHLKEKQESLQLPMQFGNFRD